ncbi:hypothetical protein AYI69_g614 [Smittium culicis]|uniref:Uncharacterized protein n=1 Tax=Smittium culicis TaxID=133412 RepID=A0A1R1YSJ7_9FUNG|nr:hypothetical protein AYI69_g614 [Smittium culicis]
MSTLEKGFIPAYEREKMNHHHHNLIDLQRSIDQRIKVVPATIDRVVEEANKAPRLPTTTPHERKIWQIVDNTLKI